MLSYIEHKVYRLKLYMDIVQKDTKDTIPLCSAGDTSSMKNCHYKQWKIVETSINNSATCINIYHITGSSPAILSLIWYFCKGKNQACMLELERKTSDTQ